MSGPPRGGPTYGKTPTHEGVTVVGASLAGLYAARALRAEGFDGRLVIVGAERHRPYDRPPLSKSFLARRPPTSTELEDLRLCDGDEEDALAAE
ncbi:hypothetical protein ADK46_20730 [Streptomyces rimosus subsp. rimosus]|uniref:Benzene 1,2-dioxygenase system ferredoxin--NAD(+) reductase subunit n=1 Tax=Streptomyces rimosus subsp. rimosus TaxID=132474 RepID=A0ABY3ZBH0_STRRM|nr:hypothetical protein ADK46_20730 [Streptomyces rimosus subsp. rimosus]UNZ07514.1 Benzene 1,2-dioxygenase system ferredoxin--NAD(+) reductase subunit [Streptomyces rimosus subsp. rimosus]UTH98967.1 Benzene 1,2-dioxygenase system ferredoxin--NAD(+) reductase subunit [Streptomyces rimosus subsp. rimosus]UTJ17066.1 Benzene 1,2-dioxygenase system ferredoxin--NAD(+) reductase subunit [Streptomyces rimosus subsp. rimosus]